MIIFISPDDGGLSSLSATNISIFAIHSIIIVIDNYQFQPQLNASSQPSIDSATAFWQDK
jgi:hypothetical protein